MKKLAIFVLLPFLSGCATWVGRTEYELVGKFGIPTKQMELPEGTAFEYMECDSTGMVAPVGNMLVTSGGSCNRKMFIVKDHKVIKEFPKKWN